MGGERCFGKREERGSENEGEGRKRGIVGKGWDVSKEVAGRDEDREGHLLTAVSWTKWETFEVAVG